MDKKLFRIKSQAKIVGVCAGLANYLDIDVTIVRLIVALGIIFGGLSFWIYIIAWLIIPEA